MNGIYETQDQIPESTMEYVDSWFETETEEATRDDLKPETAIDWLYYATFCE